MLIVMHESSSFDLPPGLLTPAVETKPGLWLAKAALLTAASAAPGLCPEACVLADRFDWAARRRSAFLAGRAVAALALRGLGSGGVVSRDQDGAPCWPPGCIGSIAHDAERAVAVAGAATYWSAVGVDVEPDAPLPADAASVVLLPQDRASLIRTFGADAEAHSRLVFAAKESVHKALHPRCGIWLEFDEVTIACRLTTSRQPGRWQAIPLSAAARQAFAAPVLEGEWWRSEGALWTLLAISRSG